MSKLFTFLNRHLAKILWTLAILVWVGVGIYYFSTRTSPSSQLFVPATTPIPAVSENLDEVEFIVGNFQEWEEIGDSPDRYIVLTDAETGQVFPKIRVGFEFSILFGDGESEDITVFAAEKDNGEYDVLYALKYFTDEEIDKLVKTGEIIEVFFEKDVDGVKNAKDENGNYLAHGLSISRSNGKTEIEQELGRVIQKPQNP